MELLPEESEKIDNIHYYKRQDYSYHFQHKQ